MWGGGVGGAVEVVSGVIKRASCRLEHVIGRDDEFVPHRPVHPPYRHHNTAGGEGGEESG